MMRPRTDSIHVLHVDDEPDFADMSAEFLERQDDRIAVRTATSAQEGFDHLAEFEIDCIVSDYDMPGMDGIEFLETVREEHPELPFILYTGKGSEEVASEAMSAGVTEYLQKGTGTSQYEVLSNRIKNAVEQVRTNRRAAREHRINRVVREINEALVQATTEAEIDEQVCKIISEAEPYRFAWIGEPDPETRTVDPRTTAGIGEDYLDRVVITTDDTQTGQGPTGTAVREGDLVVMQNIPDDPRYETWREQALEFGFRSSAAIPLDYEDKTYGVLSVYADQTGSFDEQEQQLLRNLGETIGHAYHRIHLQRQYTTQYRTLFEDAPVMVVFTKATEQGPVIEDCNETFAERLGYTRDELRETALEKYYSDASTEELLDENGYQRALTGEFTREQRTLITREGEELLTILRATPRRNTSGEIVGTHALYVDITDERQIQELEQITDLFEQAEQIANVGAWETDLRTDETWWTEQVNRIFGLPPGYEPEPGEGIEYFHPEDRPVVREAFETAKAQGEPFELELRVENDDGHRKWAHVKAEPQLEGDEIVSVRGTIQDITERKEERDRLAFLESLATQLTELSSGLLQTGQKNIEEKINEALETIGTLVDADRSYVFQIDRDEKTLSNTHEWTAEAVDPQMDSLQNLPLDTLPWWMEKMEDHETLTIQDVSDLPPEASAEQEILQEQDIKSLIVSPMISEETLVGFIGFDWVDRQETWSKNFIHVLQISGEIISSAIQREARQRELERREAYLEQSSDIISVMDSTGAVKYQSASTERVTGFSPAEVIGDTGFEHVHPDDFEKLQRKFLPFVSQPDAEVREELRVETNDGDWRWIEVRGVNKLDDSVIDGLLFSSRDITERKRREEKITELTERLELAVEGAELGVWDWDMTTDEVEFNEQWARMLGYTLDEIDPTIEAWETRVHPDDLPEVEAALEAHLASETNYYDTEHRMRTADGDWRWIRDVGRVVERDDDGDPIRAVGIHQDITDRKEQEQALRREKDRLDEFASVVSHDLRNPLNVAQGRINLAREECETDHLDAAATGIDRSLDLIEDMLTLAREGQEVSDMEPVDAADLVDTCWDTVETAEATVVSDLESAVRADRSRLRQLLENLFRNAVEHGGEDVTVRVGSLPGGFYVEDDGTGIPEDERDRVFDMGYSTMDEGTGFGLSIVKQIAEAHGWEIRVTTSSDGGARFEITGVEDAAE